jgi:hypothetical protein
MLGAYPLPMLLTCQGANNGQQEEARSEEAHPEEEAHHPKG